jgi:divalent metal cation (Fe/Co/Zn/Cd) transporter
MDISLYDAHLVADKVEDKIKKLFEDKKTHVTIHMDPYDDSEMNQLEDRY